MLEIYDCKRDEKFWFTVTVSEVFDRLSISIYKREEGVVGRRELKI